MHIGVFLERKCCGVFWFLMGPLTSEGFRVCIEIKSVLRPDWIPCQTLLVGQVPWF